MKMKFLQYLPLSIIFILLILMVNVFLECSCLTVNRDLLFIQVEALATSNARPTDLRRSGLEKLNSYRRRRRKYKIRNLQMTLRHGTSSWHHLFVPRIGIRIGWAGAGQDKKKISYDFCVFTLAIPPIFPSDMLFTTDDEHPNHKLSILKR